MKYDIELKGEFHVTIPNVEASSKIKALQNCAREIKLCTLWGNRISGIDGHVEHEFKDTITGANVDEIVDENFSRSHTYAIDEDGWECDGGDWEWIATIQIGDDPNQEEESA